jgi:hypothetical protein
MQKGDAGNGEASYVPPLCRSPHALPHDKVDRAIALKRPLIAACRACARSNMQVVVPAAGCRIHEYLGQRPALAS